MGCWLRKELRARSKWEGKEGGRQEGEEGKRKEDGGRREERGKDEEREE